MNEAEKALATPALTRTAIATQFFTRSTVYQFADGSVLSQNMFGPSYATSN